MLVKELRPRKFSDIVAQTSIEQIEKLATRKDMPHLMFIGPTGTGKTSTAEVIARVRFGDRFFDHYTELNASDERGIATVRDRIKKLSMLKGERIIFLSEFDQMTHDAQAALRRIMEKTPAKFIIDANYGNNIISAIKSRCAYFYFRPIPDDTVAEYLNWICEQKEIEPNQEVITQIVKERVGDLRGAINQLDVHIDYDEKKMFDIYIPEVNENFNNYIAAIKKSNFDEAVKYLEIIYIDLKYNVNAMLDEILNRIPEFPKEIQMRLYMKLDDTQKALRDAYQPLISFKSFTVFAIISQHLESELNEN